MELQRGLVVLAKAGRDKNKYFAILEIKDSMAYIADGRKRRIEKPKCKNTIHLAVTNTLLSEEQLATNNMLHKALREKGFTKEYNMPQEYVAKGGQEVG